jgi:hypothetical protein
MSNATILDMDALMNASMDDIEDLPPVGVPPSGHYKFKVTAETVTPTESEANKGKKPQLKFNYEVLEVNELKDPAEEGEVQVGTKFTEFFSPIKKDGTPNTVGMGFLKERVAPFAAAFGHVIMGDILQSINNVEFSASLKRKQDKNDEDRFRFELKDVVVE